MTDDLHNCRAYYTPNEDNLHVWYFQCNVYVFLTD